MDGDNFMDWEVSPESGVVVALEDANKTIREGATPPFYRSMDGVNFEQINVKLSGTPELRALGMGLVSTD